MPVCLLQRFFFVVVSGLWLIPTHADWPQGAGPNADFQVGAAAPVKWSVVRDENIAWKMTLPETGQSTPVVCGENLFFTTMAPVDGDAELGSEVVAWCCNAKTGDVKWKRHLAGKYPLRLSGCFSDSSSPAPVCDGERVVFLNASGSIACFDLQGEPIWHQDIMPAGRTVPVVHDGKLIFTRQTYPPEPTGVFPHKYADSPPELWTQLQALDMESGAPVWNTTCGVNMGCTPMLQTLADGNRVMVVGRGGGHGPPEKPDGISLIDVDDGTTLWTLPLDGFMSTMTISIRAGKAHLFHGTEHLSVDEKKGQILSRVSIVDDVPVRRFTAGTRSTHRETLADSKKGRMITQGSNLLVGPYHYFRSYTHPYLGRVNVDDGSVEYLELPLQLARTRGGDDQLLWYDPPPASQKKQDPNGVPAMKDQAIVTNEVKNSRGFVVMGDKRSTGNGWGHIAAPIITVAGPHLYVPVMNGTVYVVKWDAESLDEHAVVAINDLGPAGKSWTRASLSFAGNHAYAHTIGELICIGN
tara:strand:+ start:315044 stop:316618 length:1575 start_codon:yes stop_codon:yes gene_type:complete